MKGIYVNVVKCFGGVLVRGFSRLHGTRAKQIPSEKIARRTVDVGCDVEESDSWRDVTQRTLAMHAGYCASPSPVVSHSFSCFCERHHSF